ncbi:IclR family transcriptional regulator [Nonomuraea sp. MTCD27]|uniref:IclR family transcriptional regulator n=1 Tax=Nonomuraea sp. MTCD27 TaxID=1676747 RepID=UPI0035BF3260
MSNSAIGGWGSATPAPAVLRAGAVLDVVAARGPRPVSLQEIAKEIGIARSSAANVCSALVELRLLNAAQDGFVLGHRLVELSGFYLAGSDPIQRFNDYCRMHENVHDFTIHLATMEGLESMNVARSYGRDAIAVAPRVGQHLPANCTALGKAMLAQLDDAGVRSLLTSAGGLRAMTPLSKVDVDDLMRDIRGVRERGYAINDEESYLGVFGVAVAVRGLPESEGPYAVSCSMLKARLDDAGISAMLVILRDVAASVSGAGSSSDRLERAK